MEIIVTGVSVATNANGDALDSIQGNGEAEGLWRAARRRLLQRYAQRTALPGREVGVEFLTGAASPGQPAK
jgi:hypothetical protein